MNFTYSDELYHHGIQGMKWGVRRYQNEDGTLTEEGKKRYGKDAKKLSKLEAKENRLRYKAEKAGKSAARAFLPETGSEAFRKMTKYNKKADKVENKVRKLAEKLQEKYGNVKISELFDSDSYGSNAQTVANVSERAGVKSREMDEIRRANKEYKTERNKFYDSVSKKKPGKLTSDETDKLENYILNTVELYGHSSDVTEDEYLRARELQDKYLRRN